MKYELRAYDKDNNVYDFIMGSNDYKQVSFVAFIMYPLLIKGRLLSKDNRNPYNWFEIWNTETEEHELFKY